jgi:hypothetical protein
VLKRLSDAERDGDSIIAVCARFGGESRWPQQRLNRAEWAGAGSRYPQRDFASWD